MLYCGRNAGRQFQKQDKPSVQTLKPYLVISKQLENHIM